MYPYDNDEEVTIPYDELLKTTDKAYLLKFEDREEWFPKSQCTLNEEDNEITMPEWLAEEKGL